MATTQSFVVCDSSTLANFKSWGSAVTTGFTNASWQQSGDTGQVSFLSLGALPGAGATVYQIWTMTDTLALSSPVYVKVEFGYYTASYYQPIIYITVGTGSNGAGVLTNAGGRIGLLTGVSTASSATIVYECDFAGANNYFSMGLWRANATVASYNAMFSIERSHTAIGGDTGNYVTYIASGYSSSTYQQTIFPSLLGGPLPLSTYVGSFQTHNNSTLLNQQITVVPIWPMVGYVDYPLLGAMLCKASDVTDGLPITVNHYGSNHTYIPFKNTANVGSWAPSTTGICPAIRWE